MKNIHIKKIALYNGILLAVPFVAFGALDGLKGLLKAILDIMNLGVPLLFGAAMLYFFWGLVQFIQHAGEQKLRDEGKQKILWGIIALFIFLSIYGIINAVGALVGVPVPSEVPTNIDPNFQG